MLEDLKVNENNLRILLDPSEKKTTRSFILSVDESNKFTDFSFKTNNDKRVLLSIFQNEEILDDGFRFSEKGCWKKFAKMIRLEKQAKLSLIM